MRFGTDGIRGIFGAGLDVRLAYSAGLAAAATVSGAKIVLAMDTRESGEVLYEAAKNGLVAGGAHVVCMGILPSPAVSYLTLRLGAAAGLMITASHNPPEYNGIKFFGNLGLKLNSQEEEKIEYYIDNPPPKVLGGSSEFMDAGELYLQRLQRAVGSLSGLDIVADCGHGATYKLAGEFFRSTGANIKTLCATPDGARINVGCGALYPEVAREYTKRDYFKNSAEYSIFENADVRSELAAKGGYDIGVSLDGDGDRLSVSSLGEVLSGDSMLYNLAEMTGARTVVGTVLTNSALEIKLKEKNKTLIRTPVGDKHILRLMYDKGYTLGGEQSGHYIIRPYSLSADGLLAAGLISKYLANGHILEKIEPVPQRSISKFAHAGRLECSDIQALIKSANARLINMGRLIVRMSGTEPKMRIMVECKNETLIDSILSEFDAIL